MQDDTREFLYRSFDEPLNAEDSEKLKSALNDSAGLRAEKEQIRKMRQAASASAADGFRQGFSERVMRRIGQYEKPDVLFFESLYAVFKPLAIAALVLIVSFAAFNIHKTQQLSFSGAMAIQEVDIVEAFDPLVTFSMESVR